MGLSVRISNFEGIQWNHPLLAGGWLFNIWHLCLRRGQSEVSSLINLASGDDFDKTSLQWVMSAETNDIEHKWVECMRLCWKSYMKFLIVFGWCKFRWGIKYFRGRQLLFSPFTFLNFKHKSVPLTNVITVWHYSFLLQMQFFC